MTPLHVKSMLGLGDCIHERAVIRQLMTRHQVYLETVWPCVFHDLVPEELVLLPQATTLRTQAKNAVRQAALYSVERPPISMPTLDATYALSDMRRETFLGAMMRRCGCDLETAEFRLPVQPEADRVAARLLKRWRTEKPLLIYRPLVERGEWSACAARNPDHAAYARLFREIAPAFFTVSVADLDPPHEFMVGEPVETDVQFHHGEFDAEMLAALMARSALVFCSPGFALIMAQAVATPVLTVFGGHENARHYIDTALYAPFLGINPMKPCDCFREDHACQKAIDIARALPDVRRFAAMAQRE